MVSTAERLTYKDVEQRVSGSAWGLRSAGVKRGDRVGIVLESSVPQGVSIFAVSRWLMQSDRYLNQPAELSVQVANLENAFAKNAHDYNDVLR